AAIARRPRLGRDLGAREEIFVEDGILISTHPLRIRHLEVATLQLVKKCVLFRRLNLHRNSDFLQRILNHTRVLPPRDTASGKLEDDRLIEPHPWSTTIRIAESRFVKQLLRSRGIVRIRLPWRIRPRLFGNDRMRDLSESQQQVLDQTLAIDRVSNCLSYLDVVERRRRGIDR